MIEDIKNSIDLSIIGDGYVKQKSLLQILTENIFYEIDKTAERQYVKDLIDIDTVKKIIKNEMKIPVKSKI
jgi:hypothetical protein